MIIFGSIAIAAIFAIILIIFFKNKITWWELALILIIPTALSFGSKAVVESVSANFIEYWGDEVVSVWEEEPYNEWISQTCTREYACGTDSKGNIQYCTEPYDCSYQNDEGPRWYAKTRLGETISITESKYDKWNIQFGGNRIKTRTRKNYATRDRCSYSSGTKFQGKQVGKYSYNWKTVWNGDYLSQIPVTTKHSYENRIKASDYSVFNYIEVTDETADSLKLFKYPEFKRNFFNYPSVLGWNNKKVQKSLQKINAKLGHSKQVRIWLLIHNTDNEDIGIQQENYWVGGNKNELVINLGVDKEGNIVWNHIFTWSTSAGMVSDIKTYIESKEKFNEKNLLDIVKNTDEEVTKNWERLEFTQFDYITVEPPLWLVIMAYVFTLALCIGISVYAIRNEYDADGKNNRRNYNQRKYFGVGRRRF